MAFNVFFVRNGTKLMFNVFFVFFLLLFPFILFFFRLFCFLFFSNYFSQPKSRTTSESKAKAADKVVAQKVAPTTYLSDKNDEKTLVLLKPDAVHRNLMGDIICQFEERGFKLAALKFMQGTEEMLKEHYGDLAKKPFFPELVR